MTLQIGDRLGGYEILAPLGAGGMGEVYRARDHRIGRDVALKILPESLLESQDRLQRFQREAQSAGGLNHPNLLTIHELGVDGGRPFIVSELLEGSTLRERLSAGPLAPRRAIEYAAQIAEGLAAAHERGIVHRDLKPENIFVTRDGRVKILDFGLAKLTTPAHHPGSALATLARNDEGTDPGTVLGTAGYMSPEQVRGETVDARSDIFSLGAILYEMLSGRRAFHGSSSIDTMHAILHQDPPELSSTHPQIPPALERIVNHCLEKDPERRFQSARDLAFDFNAVSGSSSELIAPKRRARAPAAALWIAAIVVAAVASWFASRAMMHRPTPRFRRLTFQSGGLGTGVFTADQQSIVYSTQGVSGPGDVFIAPIGSPEVRSIGLTGATVLGVSRRGELALLLNARFVGNFINTGTLARVPLGGGAPREIAENVQWADWTPAGDDLLILREVAGRTRIELPLGKVRYESAGWIGTPRISPDGKSIAFVEHPSSGDDGFIVLLDADRKKHSLTPSYTSVQGLAWRPDSKEIWYTAAEQGNARALYAVGMSAKPRLITTAPGVLAIHDIDRNGRVLLVESNTRIRLFARLVNETSDRELSWLDWTVLRDLSPDGSKILFDESGEGGGTTFAVYMRNTDGSPAVRLGEGYGQGFSPNGAAALAIRPMQQPSQIYIYPTGAGEIRQVTRDALSHTSAAWVPDGRSIVFRAADKDHPARIYLQSLAGGAARPITPEVMAGPTCSLDGHWVTARTTDGTFTLFPLNGGEPIKLPEITRAHAVAGWSADSKQILFFKRSENPARVFQIEIATHRVQPWKEIRAADPVFGVLGIRVTPDGRSYAYTFVTSTSDFYLLENVE